LRSHATLLYHGFRREELCRLKIKDIHPRRGVEGALFGPISNYRTGKLDDTTTPDGVYKLVRR
jgi:hypothetical protein